MIVEIILKYLFGKGADKIFSYLIGNEFTKKIDKSYQEWCDSLPKDIDLNKNTFSETLFFHKKTITDNSNSKQILIETLEKKQIPSQKIWLNCLVDRWRYINTSEEKDKLQTFFRINEDDAVKYLSDLSDKIYKSCESITDLQIGEMYRIIKNGVDNDFENILEKIDSSNDIRHWNILVNSEYLIDEIYVEPNFNQYNSYIGEVKKIVNDRKFIDAVESIILEQNFLFIIGKYGIGKTVSSKIIQLYFNKVNWNTYFVKCKDLELSSIKNLDRSIDEMSSDSNILIIFDSFDDLHSYKRSDSEVFNKIIETTINKTKNKKNIFFIFNTRLIGRTKENTFKILSEALFDIKIYESKFISLEEFNKEKQSEWLNSIANAEAKLSGKEERLYPQELKHSGLITACKNPLFLYKVSDYFYQGEDKILTNIYSIYKEFIGKTVRGKYYYENPRGSKSIKEIVDQYVLFLRSASKIIAKNYTVFNQSIKSSDEFSLDHNVDQYTIGNDIVSSIAFKLANDNNIEYDKIDSDKLVTNMMSCYFFEHVKSINSWKFRDNNIIYYFIAEDIIETIKRIFIEENDNDKIYNQLNLKLNVFYHPFIIDLISDKISTEDENIVGNIRYRIESLINEKFIFDFEKFKGVNYPVQKFRIDAVLGILYVQLNRRNYYDNSDIINKIIFFPKVARQIDISIYNAVRRSLRSSKLDGVHIFSQDLNGYNFSNSTLRNAVFENCYIDDFVLRNTVFDNTKFINCIINHIDANNSLGNVVFKNCFISSLISKHCNIDILRFTDCVVDKLNIHFGKQILSPLVNFDKTVLKNVSLLDAHIVNIRNSSYSDKCYFGGDGTVINNNLNNIVFNDN